MKLKIIIILICIYFVLRVKVNLNFNDNKENMSDSTLSTYLFPGGNAFITQQIQNRINSIQSDLLEGYVTSIPNELILRVFSFLNIEDLARTSCTCTLWRQLASNNSAINQALINFFPHIKIKDEGVWKGHVNLAVLGLDNLTIVSTFEKSKYMPKLIKFSKLNIEGNAGFTLLTIPMGLSFNKVTKLGMPFRHIWPELSQTLGDIEAKETSRVLISNSIIESTRGMAVGMGENVIKALGASLPGLLPLTALLALTYLSSEDAKNPIRLYPSDSLTNTSCLEMVNEKNFIVGGFGEKGPAVVQNRLLFGNPANGSGAMLQLD